MFGIGTENQARNISEDKLKEMTELFKHKRTLFVDEAYMVPTIKICEIWEVFRSVIDKNRNKASICFIGDQGQTKPMMKNGLIDKLKDNNDQ